MSVVLLNGFRPATGSTYAGLTFASDTGTFDTLGGD
jgi:hypothetical protein